MLKSILLVTALTVFSFAGFSWTKIERYNGGFFGYKTVAESTSGPNSILACSDPGKLKCKGAGLGVVLDENGVVMPIDDYTPIEDEVMARLTRENTSGSFHYGSELYVKYSYDIDSDHLVMEIYSLYEAHTLGYI
jgi:hypothetical protein